MTTNEYNGWTNYETWAVCLWLDNDEASQGYWASEAVSRLNDANAKPNEVLTPIEDATYQLAEQLKRDHEDALPELNGFAADLLNAAMSEVNWQEVAEHIIATAKEQ